MKGKERRENLKSSRFALLVEFVGEIALNGGGNQGKSVWHVRWNPKSFAIYQKKKNEGRITILTSFARIWSKTRRRKSSMALTSCYSFRANTIFWLLPFLFAFVFYNCFFFSSVDFSSLFLHCVFFFWTHTSLINSFFSD